MELISEIYNGNFQHPNHKIWCIMDIGSSGIRLGIITVNPLNKTIKKIIFNKKERILLRASLQNGNIPSNVLGDVINIINKYLVQANDILEYESFEIIAFATAWARFLTDKEQVFQKIKDKTGITINVINQNQEGKFGFNALLIELNTLVSNNQSFLYKTTLGNELINKICYTTSSISPFSLNPNKIVNWDIGGGSMQFAYQDEENCIKIIGSTDSSTVFSNFIIQEVKHRTPQGNTPYPLSEQEMNDTIKLAIKKAKELFETKTLFKKIKSKKVIIFGAGQLHYSNRDYVNLLLEINETLFYKKLDLEKACLLLINKNNSDVAKSLNIKESDSRNRFTSMLLVLGFMSYLNIEKIYTLDISSVTGPLFM